MNQNSLFAGKIALAIAGLTALTAIAMPVRALEALPTEAAIETSEPIEAASTLQIVSGYETVAETKAEESDDDDNDDDDDDDDDGEETSVTEIPDEVSMAVFRDITNRSGAIVSELRIVEVQRENWENGCLGLQQPDTVCTLAIVPGWRVVVTDGVQYWVYRTDEMGSVVAFDRSATEIRFAQGNSTESSTTQSSSQSRTETRIERRTTVTTETQGSTQGAIRVEERQGTAVSVQQSAFSQTVQTAVFQAIAQRSQVSVSNLRLVEARRVTWANGCLGLPSSGSCTQALVPGWVTVVTNGQQFWVYRTNLEGSLVVYDAVASETRTAQFRASQTTRIVFSDVSSDYWANRFIVQLAQLDIIKGYPDGTYRPDSPVTRAELAAIIRRAFEVTEVRQTANFADVQTSYWAYSAIEEAYQMGFLNVVSGRQFRPTASLTRADVLFALARGLQLSTTTSAETLLSVYGDMTISSDSRLLLAALTEQGIVVNYPNVQTLNLDRVATRAEVAAFIYQTLVSLGRVEPIASPYIVPGSAVVVQEGTPARASVTPPTRQNCNQGIGNGAEGCDPGNSAPRGGSNDEGGRTPGGRSR